MRQKKKHPPLTPEQQKLVEDNLGLAYYLAQRYETWVPLELEDIQGLCLEGLVIAARKNDPLKSTRFSSFASAIIFKWVNNMTKTMRHRQKIAFPVAYLEDFNIPGDEYSNWQEWWLDERTENYEDDIISNLIVEWFWENSEEMIASFPECQQAALRCHLNNPELPLRDVRKLTNTNENQTRLMRKELKQYVRKAFAV